MNLHENNINISHENLNRIEENNLNEVNFASELPFTFHNTTFLTESEITAKKSSKTKAIHKTDINNSTLQSFLKKRLMIRCCEAESRHQIDNWVTFLLLIVMLYEPTKNK